MLINPKLLHITLMMLDLGEAGLVEKAREAMMSTEERIRELISTKGENGKLAIEFNGLDHFGDSWQETRVVFA